MLTLNVSSLNVSHTNALFVSWIYFYKSVKLFIKIILNSRLICIIEKMQEVYVYKIIKMCIL